MFDLAATSDIIGLFVLGIGAALLGFVGLLQRKATPERSLRFALILSAVLGAISGLAAITGMGSEIWAPVLLLTGVWLAFAGTRTALAQRYSQSAAKLLLSPRFQALGLFLAGFALITWQARALDRQLEKDILATDEHFSATIDNIELEQADGKTALTDAGKIIQMWKPNEASSVPTPPSVEETFIQRLGMNMSLIQTSPADLKSNCHGWVFTGGKHWVRGGSVPQILSDNEYRVVSRPLAGDIAVFRDGNEQVTHTALVRAIREDGSVLLESKWGKLGCYIHTAAKHAYMGQKMTYYTTPRGTHLLRGMGDETPEAATVPVSADPKR